MHFAKEIGSPCLIECSPKLGELGLLLFPSMFLDDPVESTNVFNSARVVLRLVFQLEQPDFHISVLAVQLVRLLTTMCLAMQHWVHNILLGERVRRQHAF